MFVYCNKLWVRKIVYVGHFVENVLQSMVKHRFVRFADLNLVEKKYFVQRLHIMCLEMQPKRFPEEVGEPFWLHFEARDSYRFS